MTPCSAKPAGARSPAHFLGVEPVQVNSGAMSGFILRNAARARLSLPGGAEHLEHGHGPPRGQPGLRRRPHPGPAPPRDRPGFRGHRREPAQSRGGTPPGAAGQAHQPRGQKDRSRASPAARLRRGGHGRRSRPTRPCPGGDGGPRPRRRGPGSRCQGRAPQEAGRTRGGSEVNKDPSADPGGLAGAAAAGPLAAPDRGCPGREGAASRHSLGCV